MTAPSQPTGLSNMQAIAKAATALVNVSLPATVLEYDHDEQRATVAVVPCRRYRQDGEMVCYRPDPIPNVPVMFTGGSGGSYSDTWPLQAGDRGVVIFCDRSMDEWLSTGASQTEPQDPRRHDITDAWFFPGARPFADPVDSTGIDASARVIKGDLVKLGSSSASDYVALASLADSNNAALETALFSAIAAAITGLSGVAPELIALQTALTTALASWPTSVAATKVQAE